MQTAVGVQANCSPSTRWRDRLDEALATKSWTAYGPGRASIRTCPRRRLDLDERRSTIRHIRPASRSMAATSIRRPGTAGSRAEQAEGHSRCGRVHQIRRRARRKGVLRLEPHGEQKEATKRNLAALGFPMGGNVDTVLLQKTGRKWAFEARRARASPSSPWTIALLLLFGDNIGDFSDTYSPASLTAPRPSKR